MGVSGGGTQLTFLEKERVPGFANRWGWEALALGTGPRGWPAAPVNSPAREVPIYRSFAVLNSLWKD